jgi:hypothetical protein
VSEEINQLLQKTALQRLIAYRSTGDLALGTYNDQSDPTQVGRQFALILSYDRTLQQQLPSFYNYLLSYPSAKPPNVENVFYWADVKFGLKPTLRIVQRVIMRGNLSDQVAYAIADKQLYASHYFEAALDLSFLHPRNTSHDAVRLLLDHDHGFRANRFDWFQGIDHSKSRCRPIGHKPSGFTDDGQERTGKSTLGSLEVAIPQVILRKTASALERIWYRILPEVRVPEYRATCVQARQN